MLGSTSYLSYTFIYNILWYTFFLMKVKWSEVKWSLIRQKHTCNCICLSCPLLWLLYEWTCPTCPHSLWSDRKFPNRLPSWNQSSCSTGTTFSKYGHLDIFSSYFNALPTADNMLYTNKMTLWNKISWPILHCFWLTKAYVNCRCLASCLCSCHS